jgi:hypothetical protein
MFSKPILYFLTSFFLIVSSIFIHEWVHVQQFTSSKNNVDEVCLLGWKEFEDGTAAGWVKSTLSNRPDIDKMEVHAHLVQFVYIIAGGIMLNLWIGRFKSHQ